MSKQLVIGVGAGLVVIAVSTPFTLWGGIGLLLAIPITAGIKAVFDNVASLQGYGKLLGD